MGWLHFAGQCSKQFRRAEGLGLRGTRCRLSDGDAGWLLSDLLAGLFLMVGVSDGLSGAVASLDGGADWLHDPVKGPL